jgi:hypothetical protein
MWTRLGEEMGEKSAFYQDICCGQQVNFSRADTEQVGLANRRLIFILNLLLLNGDADSISRKVSRTHRVSVGMGWL